MRVKRARSARNADDDRRGLPLPVRLHAGESAILDKEVRRLQASADQLTQEKAIWIHERTALEGGSPSKSE